MADALSRLPLQLTVEDQGSNDFSPVHMLTDEIPADSARIAHFRRATAEDTTSGLLMGVVANGWPQSRKDCHPLLVDY